MNLVFITRKVDRGDPLTGFIFTWLNQLAGQLEKLYVICQEKGDVFDLPLNVEVYSFGKEKGHGKIRQGFSLFALSFTLGKKTDGFFVHMHPFYAMLAWLPAKIFGKKIVLWYTHKAVDCKLKIAHILVDQVLTASKESFRLPSTKVKIVGHGIDLQKFKIHPPRRKNSKFRIVSVGRISPVKDYQTLLEASAILVNERKFRSLEVAIYGQVGLPRQEVYFASLIEFVKKAGLEEFVSFRGAIKYDRVEQVYQEADLFVNLSHTGSLDKSVLEAAACQTMVLTSNEAFVEPLQKISSLLLFEENRVEDLANKILKIYALPTQDKAVIQSKLRGWVEAEHDLQKLVSQILNPFEKSR